jgi:HK97 gp10 family phage protein
MNDAPNITVDASGAIKGLESLERKVAKKYVRKSLRAACKVTHAVAVATAPVASGLTKQNIKVRSAGVKKGVIKMIVGIGKKWFSGPTFYSGFVAFGHKVGNRKLGDARRQLAPNDWLEKAYESTKAEAVDVFAETIGQLIESNED